MKSLSNKNVMFVEGVGSQLLAHILKIPYDIFYLSSRTEVQI